MNIEDVEEVGPLGQKLKITFTNDSVEEIVIITVERTELQKLLPYIGEKY